MRRATRRTSSSLLLAAGAGLACCALTPYSKHTSVLRRVQHYILEVFSLIQALPAQQHGPQQRRHHDAVAAQRDGAEEPTWSLGESSSDSSSSDDSSLEVAAALGAACRGVPAMCALVEERPGACGVVLLGRERLYTSNSHLFCLSLDCCLHGGLLGLGRWRRLGLGGLLGSCHGVNDRARPL